MHTTIGVEDGNADFGGCGLQGGLVHALTGAAPICAEPDNIIRLTGFEQSEFFHGH